jgi:septal ring factor EnvC (AmiA/AmiB activator)
LQFRSEVGAKDFISARHLPKRSVYASGIMYRMAWTDERMDDFAKHTDQRFDAVDQRFDAVDKRFDAVDQRFDAVDKRFEAVDQRFEAVNQRFDAVDQRFDRLEREVSDLRTDLNARFDGLQRTLILTSGGIIGTLIAGIVSLVVTQI